MMLESKASNLMPMNCFVRITQQFYLIFAYRGIVIPLLCSYCGGFKVFHPPMSKLTWV